MTERDNKSGSKAMADLPPPAMGMRRRDEVPSRAEKPKQIGSAAAVTPVDDEKEASLTRLQEGSKNMKQIEVKDGQFENYPEIPQETSKKLIERGIVNLFPVQQNSFYPIYNREDIISRDLTGSGKTLAFCLPITEYLRKNKMLGKGQIQAIFMCPTRELALQVQNELARLKHYPGEFESLTVYGGVSIEDQTYKLRRGVDFFVGTCGRVLDHIERGNLDFTHIKTVVLDEADQMLKQGFKEEVDKILGEARRQCGRDLQICLFSATIPRWVRDVAQAHMKREVRIVDLAMDLKNKTARNVQHLAIDCPFQNRLKTLGDLLVVYGQQGKTIVFTQTKADANSLLLSEQIKLDIEVMHGDIAQNQREVTMKRFKEGKFRVLVATDVASRGLDIPNVDLVIQLEPPKETETYIHRSGRTARAGASGTCITFFMGKTRSLIEMIESQAGIKFNRIGVPQPEQVIQASAMGVLSQLDDVNPKVLKMFKQPAEAMIKRFDGDSEKALCSALAYISGFYKQQFTSRSVLTGQDRQITVEIKSNRPDGRMQVRDIFGILRKFWPPGLVDSIRVIKGTRSMNGGVFDLPEDRFGRFMDNYEHLIEAEHDRLDFTVDKCTELPELAEDDPQMGGGGWRNDGGNGVL